jgi:PAS domain S-box-containing protein
MKPDKPNTMKAAPNRQKASLVRYSETFPDSYISSSFRELMNCVDNFILVFDSELRILTSNRYTTDFFGYPECELVTKKISILVDEDDRRRIIKLVRKAKNRMGGNAVFVTRLNTKFYADFSISPLAITDGKPRGYLLVGHLADGKNLLQKESLSNGFTTRVLQGLANPTFISVFPSRTIYACNESAISVLGFRRDELIGRCLKDFVASIEGCVQDESLTERLDRTYAEVGFSNERMRFLRKKGLPILCDCMSLPLFTIDGSMSFKISILFDRSHEERREAEFSDLILRVKQLSSDLEKFIPKPSNFQNAKRLSGLGFTSRQIEITRFIIQGRTSKEIGLQLGIAESTVKNHLAAMYRKIEVRSRIDFLRILDEKHMSIS